MRGILFDKDGTLVDFEATWSGVLQRLAFEFADGDAARASVLMHAGGLDPVTGRIRAGSVFGAGNTRDLVRCWMPAESGAAFDAIVAHVDRAFVDNAARNSVPVAGMKQTLHALAADDLAMGVATNDATAAALAALAALGVAELLPLVFGYDAVARPKPAPDSVHAFCEAIGAAPREIAVVGDNLHDLEMARAAGAGAAVGVLTGNSAAHDLAPLADVVLASVRDLPGWLRSRAAEKRPR